MSEAAISGIAGAGAAFWRRLSLSPARFLAIALAAWSSAQVIARGPQIANEELGDTDNYMRLVEWRDFLAGQDWFDLRQHRFVGPDGGDMHFSRIPDILMSALHWLTAPLIGSGAAEQFVLLAYPPLLLLGFLTATMLAARRIAGNRAAIAAITLSFLAPPVVLQFAPGRIDHQGLALALSMTSFSAVIAALSRPRFAIIAALAAALAVAVSLETAPVAAAAFLVPGLQWVFSGDGRPLRLIGYAMLIAAPAILFATLGGGSLSDMHCDAFAAPAASALIGAGVIAVVLSFCASIRRRPGSAPLLFAALRSAARLSSILAIALPGHLAGWTRSSAMSGFAASARRGRRLTSSVMISARSSGFTDFRLPGLLWARGRCAMRQNPTE